MTNLLIVGHGRMGKLVESLAAGHDCRIAGIVTASSAANELAAKDFGAVDVAIDFSTAAAVKRNLEAMAGRGWNVVIGTTGWQSDEAACRAIADKARHRRPRVGEFFDRHARVSSSG